MPIIPFQTDNPKIAGEVFVAPDAWVIGKVSIAEKVSIFFAAVVRGDIQKINIGAGTNLQEHVLLHTSSGLADCVVGTNVTVGHRAILHGCEVEDNCIIGMGSTILDGATIGENCIVGANSLVTMNVKIPAGHLVLGSPAKAVRKLRAEEIESIEESALHYQEMGRIYREYFPVTTTR